MKCNPLFKKISQSFLFYSSYYYFNYSQNQLWKNDSHEKEALANSHNDLHALAPDSDLYPMRVEPKVCKKTRTCLNNSLIKNRIIF